MPEISRFFGIIILMHWREHPPPHVHAIHGDDEAIITLDGVLLEGSLPRRQLVQVREWIDLHRDELIENWDRVTTKRVLLPVEPLR